MIAISAGIMDSYTHTRSGSNLSFYTPNPENSDSNDWLFTNPILVDLQETIDAWNRIIVNLNTPEKAQIIEHVNGLIKLKEKYINSDSQKEILTTENEIKSFTESFNLNIIEYANKYLRKKNFGLSKLPSQNSNFYPLLNLNINTKDNHSLQNCLTYHDKDKESFKGTFAMYHYYKSKKPIHINDESGREILKEQVRRKSKRRESLFDKSKHKLDNTSNHILIEVKDIILWIGQEAYMSFSLYDSSEDKFVSDEIILTLLDTNPVKIDGTNAIVFRDVPSSILEDIWIVCKIVRFGSMKYDALKVDQFSKSSSFSDTYKSKRPYSASAIPLSDCLSPSSKSKEFSMPLYEPTNEEHFHHIHQLIINESRNNLRTLSKAKSIMLNVNCYKGQWSTVKNIIKLQSYHIAYPLKVSEQLLNLEPESRNDLYITLEEGSFNEKKNIEIIVEIRPKDITRKLMPKILYKSIVYYHVKEPKWSETFKIPMDDIKEPDHLYFLIRHVHENGKTSDQFFAYLPLRKSDQTFIPNGSKKLLCYKIQRNADDTYYLKENLKPYKSDHIKINTNFVSTKFTENIPLMNLINWKSNISNLLDIISKCTILPKKDIVNFCRDVLDSVFDIMEFSEESRMASFYLFISLLSSCIDDNFSVNDHSMIKLVDKYLNEQMKNIHVHFHLIDCIKQTLSKMQSRSSQRYSALILKSIEYIMKFIIKSKILYNEKKNITIPLNEDIEFKRDILSLINEIINILLIQKPELVGIQSKLLKIFPVIMSSIKDIFFHEELSFIILKLLNSFHDSNQVQLNVEKLLLLETYQFSSYIGIYHIFNQLKIHMRNSVEEQLHCVRILKNILSTMMNSALLGKLDVHSMIECVDYEFSYDIGSISKKTKGKIDDKGGRGPIKVKDLHGSSHFKNKSFTSDDIQMSNDDLQHKKKISFKSRNSSEIIIGEEDVDDEDFDESLLMKLQSISKTKRKSIPSELMALKSLQEKESSKIVIPERKVEKIKLIELIIELIPSIRRILKKSEDHDRDLRIDLGVCFISIIKIISVKKLCDYVNQCKDEEAKTRIIKSIIETLLPLLLTHTYPLTWPDLLYQFIHLVAHLIEKLLVPYALSNLKPVSMMSEEDLYLFIRLFKLSCASLTHISLQLERYNSRSLLIQKNDIRVYLLKNIIELWNHFEPCTIYLIPDVTVHILEMIVNRNQMIKSAGIKMYFSLTKRDIHVNLWKDKYITSKTDPFYDKDGHRNDLSKSISPIIEVSTIHALEELSKSSNWDEESLRQFFGQKMNEISSSLDHHSSQKLKSFMKDILSLISLLDSLRDLPHGAEYDEERAYALTQLMTYLRQSKHANAYLEYAFKLSRMYEESEQYVEAAFATLLHADILKWSKEVLPPTLHYPSSREDERKLLLLEQAMDLFNKGKAWEEAINISQQIVEAYKTHFYDYNALSNQLRFQSELYLKIINQDRYFSNYFFVGYYGTGFPKALRDKSFIYRGLELERINHFIQRMKKKFPSAEIITSTDSNPIHSKKGIEGKQYLQIFSVKPSSEAEMKGLEPIKFDESIPERIRNYHLSNNVKVFHYSIPFYKKDGVTNEQNEFSSLWLSNTFVVTEDSFPNIQRRLEIVKKEEIILSPIEKAISDVVKKNKELIEITRKVQSGEQGVKIDRLSMSLSSILDAAVNGGTAKYQEAFLSKEYISQNTDERSTELITELKVALIDQLKYVKEALDVHGDLCQEKLKKLHEHLEGQYKKMYKQTYSILPELGVDSRFKVIRLKDVPEVRPSILKQAKQLSKHFEKIDEQK